MVVYLHPKKLKKIKFMSEKEVENSIKENGKPVDKNVSSEKNEGEKSGKTHETSAGKISPEAEQPETEQIDLKKQLIETLAKNHELNDKYLRLYSDFDNFRKRTSKERVEIFKYAGEELITLLLPVLDDFERAIKSNESLKDKTIFEGIKLVNQKMKNILTQQGLKEMEIGEGEFNSELHEAITKIPVPEKEKKGKIIEVIEKGYYLNDKVIRHAKVVVGS